MKLPIALILFIAFANNTLAQLITGVTDRGIYTDSAAFTIPSDAGFSYNITLNGAGIAPGSHIVNVMDYYELLARRTEISTGAESTQSVHFIVVSSRRGTPELGLIEWTPYPPIPSAREEFSNAQLTVIAPQSFPANLHIPIVAWIDDGPGNARRVNGNITAASFPANSLPLRRGVGHTFLPPQSGSVSYDAQLHSLTALKYIQIEFVPVWQEISGDIPPGTGWPVHSRIHVTGNITIAAGNSLMIGAGSVVWLDPGVNITNSGRMIINGTKENPVIFTSAAAVSPEQHAGAWGGFLLRGASAELIANGAIFTGSGSAANFSFSPGVSHRSEQALLLVHSGAKSSLTNCFIINNAGQIANGYNAQIVFDHCLLQRAITAGEYVATTLTINNSAVIEFPSIDGEVNAAIADADYDGLYFTSGSYLVKDSLLGFAKDDAIDAGGDGNGDVTITNCWFESTLHEGLAWSGGNRLGSIYDTVFMNCGQAIECGYSAGPNSPFAYNERVLCLANAVGARFGDNYTGTTGTGSKQGFLTVTNSILIYNYRDVFGRCWDDTWNYRDAQMDVRGNYLTDHNPHHPDNTLWDPLRDASLLNPYIRISAKAPVGIGFANWTPLTRTNLTNGIPIRLSSFTTHTVEIECDVESQTAPLAFGSLEFQPGQTVESIAWSGAFPTNELLRIVLRNPSGAEITTATQYLLVPPTAETETRLHLATFSGENLLYWTDPTLRLETASTLNNPIAWTPINTTSPYTLPSDAPMRFYRLAR